MSYSFIQIDTNQMTQSSILLFISFFGISIILLLLYLFFKEKIKDIKNNNIDSSDDFYDRYENLDNDQVDFYFELGKKNLDNIFKTRQDENTSILSHIALFVAAFTIFFILGKWTYRHHDDLIYFLPLVLFLSIAFFNLIISIWSVFQALRLPYAMPPQIFHIDKEYTNLDVATLKKMFIERFASDAKTCSASNFRKMKLLDHSHFFLKIALIFLGTAFLFICCREYLSFIIA